MGAEVVQDVNRLCRVYVHGRAAPRYTPKEDTEKLAACLKQQFDSLASQSARPTDAL